MSGAAHAENDQLEDAIADFQTLVDAWPNEVAAIRNLMVAQVLSLTGTAPPAGGDRASLVAAASRNAGDVERP